jgi:hypothetical protein
VPITDALITVTPGRLAFIARITDADGRPIPDDEHPSDEHKGIRGGQFIVELDGNGTPWVDLVGDKAMEYGWDIGTYSWAVGDDAETWTARARDMGARPQRSEDLAALAQPHETRGQEPPVLVWTDADTRSVTTGTIDDFTRSLARCPADEQPFDRVYVLDDDGGLADVHVEEATGKFDDGDRATVTVTVISDGQRVATGHYTIDGRA